MTRRSAGILMYRMGEEQLEVLLVHPGGPLWANRDRGAWSIPKGEYEAGEDPLTAARREFREELGSEVTGAFAALGSLVQRSRKEVTAFAVAGDFAVAALKSNTFEMEWPPRSGRKRQFPEVDRAQWFGVAEARQRILPGQAPFIDRLLRFIAVDDRGDGPQ